MLIRRIVSIVKLIFRKRVNLGIRKTDPGPDATDADIDLLQNITDTRNAECEKIGHVTMNIQG